MIEHDDVRQRRPAGLPQKRRVPVGDRVVREHERRHQQRGLDGRQEEIGLEDPHQRHPVGRAMVTEVLLPFEPDRTFGHARPDPEHEQRREDAQPEHRSPREIAVRRQHRIERREHRSRDDVSPAVAALQEARDDAAQPGRPVLDHQRHARRPLATHPNPKQRPEGEEHRVGGRESAERREHREPEDRQHQRQLAAPSIRSRASKRSADQAHHQRDRAQDPGQEAVNRERPLDVDQDEGEDREVEPVEHPAEKRRPERAPLIAVDLAVPRRRCRRRTRRP